MINEAIAVVLNPGSGSSGDEYQRSVETALAAAGRKFQIVYTDPKIPPEQMVKDLADSGVAHVMACGGDGTVMGVINGLCKTKADVRLSIVPGGTANLVATALKIPMDVDGAVAVALAGRDRVIDVGLCEGYYFALGVGVGLTERLVSQASAEWKERIGRWAYAAAMLGELGSKPHSFRLKLDDQPPALHRGVAVVIANTGDIGGGLTFAPNAEPDDGLLDVCILHRFELGDAARLLLRALRGVLPGDRAVSFLQAKTIELDIQPPLDVQIDGEALDLRTPLRAEVVPQALRVRVPDVPDGHPAA